MSNKINTETRKLKLEIEIPYIYYEALIANPSLEEDMMMQKVKKSVFDTLSKAYHNPRILPAPVKKYLEDKYGKPIFTEEKKVPFLLEEQDGSEKP